MGDLTYWSTGGSMESTRCSECDGFKICRRSCKTRTHPTKGSKRDGLSYEQEWENEYE